jgi:hypothetical protein
MSLLKAYLNPNTTVTWTPAQRKSDGSPKTDGSGKILYDVQQTIQAILNEDFKLIRDKNGAEVVSSGNAKVLELVQIGDKINGRDVIALNVKRGLFGENEGRVVYLK